MFVIGDIDEFAQWLITLAARGHVKACKYRKALKLALGLLSHASFTLYFQLETLQSTMYFLLPEPPL